MQSYIRRQRENAGLTQAQLAEKMKVSVAAVQNWESGRTRIDNRKYFILSEILSVPIDVLVKELLLEADEYRKDKDHWPDFLFSKETNDIIDTLHLNKAQQDLFGLLYIYGAESLQVDIIDYDTYGRDLRRIPYGFVEKVGSIRFMNQADALFHILKFVKPDYLMKILKLKPEEEFNVRYLSGRQICEFVDHGRKGGDLGPDDENEELEELEINISMEKAEIMLPLLEKHGPVHITDGAWGGKVRSDLPEELVEGIVRTFGGIRELWEEEDIYKQEKRMGTIRSGLETVTVLKPKKNQKEGQELCWIWEINEKGRKLLQWFREEK